MDETAKTISVCKFGGSSFANPDRYRAIARDLAERAQQGEALVVVVSAPPGLTEDWRLRLTGICPHPSEETIAGLLPRADTVGAFLLQAALDGIGMQSRVLTGAELGIVTDSNFCRARIRSVELGRLRRLLDEGRIVIVPGGQAVNEDLQLTWLGKNSSDLSAIAIAAALGTDHVDIHSDVEGIYSSDPGIVPDARLLGRVSACDAIAMSLAGAKVLHHGGVSRARQAGLAIRCRANTGDYRIGTTVGDAPPVRAVVPDARSLVLAFADIADQPKAVHALQAAEVPTVVVDAPDRNGSGMTVVVTCGFFDAAAFLANAGIRARETGEKLLTVLDSGAIVHSLHRDVDALHAAARDQHRRLYAPVANRDATAA